MSADQKLPRPPHRWRRRISWSFLILFLGLALFHRPIFFEGTRYFILRAAKQQNLSLDYEMSGSIFSTLTVSNLRAKPTEPGPIQRLEIGTINLQYSLLGLIRHGLPAFLQTVELKNVFVEITPAESPPPAKAAQPQQLKFPALFPSILDLENVNFLSHSPQGDTQLAGFFFSLFPDRPGLLKIQTLDIPNVRRWTDISAATTFRERNLLLTGLVIGPEISLRSFNLDTSKLDRNELGLGLDGTFFGAATTLRAQVADLNAANRLVVKADCAGLSFQSVSDYLKLHLPVKGTLAHLALTFTGEPEKPAGWTGTTDLQLDDLAIAPQQLGDLTLTTKMETGKVTASSVLQMEGQNHLQLQAEAVLPAKLADFAKTTAYGNLTLTAPDLGALTKTLPQPLMGDATLTTDFHLSDGKLSARTQINSTRLATPAADLGGTHFTLQVDKDLSATGPVFHALTTNLQGGVASLRFQDYTADALSVSLGTRDGNVQLEQFSVGKKGNSLRAEAEYVLPDDLRSWQKQPLRVNLGVDAPELQAFAVSGSNTLRGNLQINGHATAQNGIYNGDFAITGRNIAALGLPIPILDGKLSVVNNQASLSALNLQLNDKNTIHAEGNVGLASPFAYHGSLDLRLTDLSIFQPLLKGPKSAPPLTGSLIATWQGTGEAPAFQHQGTAAIDLTGGRFGDLKNLTAHVVATYTPTTISIPKISAGSSLGTVGLSINWQDKRLSVTNLTVQQQKLLVLSGSASLPLDLSQLQNPAALLPGDQPIDLSLKTDKLDLKTLFAQLGQQTPPLTGTIDLLIGAHGSLNAPLADVDFHATQLRSPSAEDFAPAEITLNAALAANRLTLNGTVRQRLIQPLQIKGDLPFNLSQIRKAGAIDPKTPLSLELKLPQSSLTFLSTLVPAIRQSRGTAAIDVKVNGTVAQPNLAGRADVDLTILRFSDPSLPPVDHAMIDLGFAQNRLTVERCRGGIAGGSFDAGGKITLTRLDNPIFDLHLTTRNALVVQNDDVTARVTSDVKLTGPLNAATVAGTVGVTRSSFFKTIDILPIGLPGRPAPQPPDEPTVISFPKPPLRDWKFDLAIKTFDPFLIQGNLAKGRISMDLHLGGTGEKPWMDGSVHVDELNASLPFSRLSINSSQVYFNRAEPFIPQLDIRGTSTIRDYEVQVNIFGPATNPQATFTSEPPLPQSDIVTLIATGMTTTELTKDPNAIAGRAAILLFQKLYNSIFTRNRPPADDTTSFLSRIELDFGATDPKTGKQSSSVRIPVSDQIALVGGVDVGGNFRGQIKYLIRFK